MPDNTQRLELPEVTPIQEMVFSRWNQALTQLDAIVDMYVLEVSADTPPEDPAAGDTYIIGDSPTGDWADQAGKIACYIEDAWSFYAPFNGMHAFVAPDAALIVYHDEAWTAVGSADFATRSGIETLSGKSLSGAVSFYTNGSRIGITGDGAPLATPEALVHIVNNDTSTCALRATSYWSGSTATPYQNNDCSLWETFNNIDSTSLNRSWSGSFANAYNNIPADVVDAGERTGIIGWAVSVARPGYTHAGTLQQQIGCNGVAGFQGAGSAPTAVINNATGVRGLIYNDSEDATIVNARAGEFVSANHTGIIQNNFAIFASATNGTSSNYSFFGQSGKFYNAEQLLVGNIATQSSSFICARNSGNAYEFGHPNPNGYASSFGATWSSGAPFLALCAEADPAGNTFTTRGKRGTVLWNDLAGALIFSRVTDPDAAAQNLVESARFDADGHLVLATTPYLPTGTPASSTAPGKTGELCWDNDYVYVCVAPNSWKRTALSSW